MIVGAQDGTTGETYANDETDASEVRGFPEGPDAISALITGQVDAAIIDQPVAADAIEKQGGIEIAAGDPDRRALRVRDRRRTTTALLEAMNEALATIKDDGTIAELYQKYFRSRAAGLGSQRDDREPELSDGRTRRSRAKGRRRAPLLVRRLAWPRPRGGASMDFILNYYFDFGTSWATTSTASSTGFWLTLKLSIISGVARRWPGAWCLAVLRQLPGRALAPVRWLDDRLHRRLPRHPAAAGARCWSRGSRSSARRSERRGAPASRSAMPDLVRRAVAVLVRRDRRSTITYGAYMAEVYRAGIEAVPRGQMEAARSLGMSHGQAMRYVIVPQAVRKVIPPLLNDFIALMKDTSLVSFLGAARGRPGRPRRPDRDVQRLRR